MPNRSYTSQSYRYGFQGQERDDEIKGSGNSINYKYRMHDPRLGRFKSIDPLAAEYPHNSPYAFSENRVIDGVELEGLEYIHYEVSFMNESGQIRIVKTDEIDFDNPTLNLINSIHKAVTGDNIDIPYMKSHVVKSPIDGLDYIFSSEEEA